MSAVTYQRVKNLPAETVSVRMNEVRLLVFGTEGKQFLLTAGLNGCFGVAIVSRTAAILGHIPPNPGTNPQDLGAGDRNIVARMREIAALMQKYHRFFSVETDTLVVSAIYMGEIALPDQKEIIESYLKQMGLNHVNVEYVATAGQLRSDAHGTLIIDGQASRPSIYVEDQCVLRRQVEFSSPSRHASSQPQESHAVHLHIGRTPASTRVGVTTPATPETGGAVGSQVTLTSSRYPQQDTRHSQYQDSRISQEGTRHSQHQDSRHSQHQDSQDSQQDSQEESRQSQQDALRRVHDGLMEAESQEGFLRMVNELNTRFGGQSADFQRRFLEVVRHVRDERQRRRR